MASVRISFERRQQRDYLDVKTRLIMHSPDDEGDESVYKHLAVGHSVPRAVVGDAKKLGEVSEIHFQHATKELAVKHVGQLAKSTDLLQYLASSGFRTQAVSSSGLEQPAAGTASGQARRESRRGNEKTHRTKRSVHCKYDIEPRS